MGALAHFLLSTLAAITLMTQHNIAVSGPHYHLHPSVSPTASVSPVPSPDQHVLKATATVSQFGKTAHLTATFPKNGGPVSGTIFGDCTGSISGVYSGENNGKQLQGTANASCPIVVFSIHPTATFSGIVNSNDTSASVNYSATANGQTQNGSFIFSISQ